MSDWKQKNRERVYKRFLSSGLILNPKQSTLERYGLVDYWEAVKAQKYKTLEFRDRKSFLLASRKSAASDIMQLEGE
jgi:hypothetical protein